MSLFKEKDDLIKEAFQHLEDSDSDQSETEEDEDVAGDNASMGDLSFDEKPALEVDDKDGTQNSKSNQSTSEYSINTRSKLSVNRKRSNSEEVFCIDDDDDSDIDCIEVSNTKDCATSTPLKANQDDQIINISSDDDDDIMDVTPQKSNPSILTHNTSIDDRDFTLKITMAGIYSNYPTTYKASIAESLKTLLDDLSAKGRCLKLYLRDNEIDLDKSPQTLGLKPGNILQAIEVPLNQSPIEEEKELEKVDEQVTESDHIRIKLQDGNRKHTKDFKISMKEPLGNLKEVYIKAFSIDTNVNITLLFDGDPIDDDQTAEDLELEDGFAVDVVIN